MLSRDERRILIIDDEEQVLSALRRVLAPEGYKIFLASDPKAALALLRSTAMDVVLADHVMPHMTGLDFLKMLRLRYPDTIRIMLTGHADTETAISALNHGEVYRLITKPWDNDMLKMLLRGAFEQVEMEREVRGMLLMARQADRARRPTQAPIAQAA